jgi:hypothetical protein
MMHLLATSQYTPVARNPNHFFKNVAAILLKSLLDEDNYFTIYSPRIPHVEGAAGSIPQSSLSAD